MKSRAEELKKRGYIISDDILKYKDYSEEELYNLLSSRLPYERTISVRLLSNRDINDSKLVSKLLESLIKEKALYTKIEICNLLEKGNKQTCYKMIAYLGKVGNNQYKSLPMAVSKKKSYPLPRDIIARTLGRMKTENIEVLLEVLNTNDYSKISEVLDAIGFMIFYNNELSTIKNFNIIKDTLEKNKSNEIILWKSIQCLSAFNLKENREYLNVLKQSIKTKVILSEIERSLKLIAQK